MTENSTMTKANLLKAKKTIIKVYYLQIAARMQQPKESRTEGIRHPNTSEVSTKYSLHMRSEHND